MARKPPGAVRARLRSARTTTRPVRQIHGVARRTQAAVRRTEARHLWHGAVAEALLRYERFLKLPGRHLYLPHDTCCCDPVEARDTLEDALRHLPPAARRDLYALVARLDDEFRRRTLPNPLIAEASPYAAAAWWRQRIREI
ncbi:hypothetical protein LG634_00840 [Streptomyces bambusae]|uniref:hypothetical protein n=1 Tax=Streptomyces bambusae TaxID=1550616 RepID=UPI001CFF1E53|nr:hypothetical protein [Streptomyces bambusae]MCB5163400.1 hypothetical protein [Streptomyces bambusae]